MKKLVKLLRIIASVALVVAWYHAFTALVHVHYAACPEAFSTPYDMTRIVLPGIALILLMIFPVMAIALASGYKLHRLHWFFLEITKPDKLRIRLTKKFGFTFRVLPPRTDGTSPYAAYWCSAYIIMAVLGVVLALLTALCRHMPVSRYLMAGAAGVVLCVFLLPLLPRRNNSLEKMLAFRKSRDLRRAWECSLHVTAQAEQKVRLQDMPDAWFLPYPAEIADHPIVRVANFNHAARLINQEHYLEAYEMLRYFFNLKPAPDTNMPIACAILNGAICEALADLQPMCLSQLDHPTLKLPLPPGWEYQRLQAEYARALFLHRDEAEAAAMLPKLEEARVKYDRTREGLEKLQRKAGILPNDAPEGEHA